ncbi:MAG: recombinase family protein [Candidatus Pacearchaeota archaeon]|nr:recombinase family protein [Candidatus Pacearchaeota archaeon]
MDKAIIYLRVSTKEQNENLQLDDCINYCKNHNFEIVGTYQERVSAWKENIVRAERDKVIEEIHLGKANHIVVWAFDRWIRKRDTLIDDINALLNLGCKLHSVKDSWYESINVEGPLGRTIREFMLGLIGSIAEMESQRRSERIWLGKQNTKKKQGPKFKLSEENIKEIINFYSSFKSLRKTAEEYNKIHKPHISYGTVSHVIKSN